MHVADPRFGELISPDHVIMEMVQKVSQKLGSTDTALVMLEKYETVYGLHNHDAPDPNRPLAMLAINAAEDASTGSSLYERIDQFEERKIFQRFGVALDKFLELPSDICMRLMEVAKAKQDKEGQMASNVLASLQHMEGKH